MKVVVNGVTFENPTELKIDIHVDPKGESVYGGLVINHHGGRLSVYAPHMLEFTSDMDQKDYPYIHFQPTPPVPLKVYEEEKEIF